MNFFGYGAIEDVEIVLDGAEKRKKVEHRISESKSAELSVYYDGETVSGAVSVGLKSGTKIDHKGIKIELIGQIEILYDRTNLHDFTTLTKQLASPGVLNQSKVFSFQFPHVEKPFESYFGSNVRLRYFLKVTVGRRLTDFTKELEFIVHTLSTYPEANNNSIKMEVGIEDCLHIEFEYNKQKYHLKDAIIGKIYFLLVRVKIKHMEVHIIKRESTGTGPNVYHEDDTIAKFEIMDGAPVKGESIPIRLFLAGYDLTPSMRDVNKKFSVRYFLNLVLIDEEDRRYFKQQEVILWRKADIPHRQGSKSLEESTQRFEK
uniref:Vacuolar protein sorting-associated protein 26B n=1 Tax=Phallusia mammillata TaxID=59560 RepID=A0A6F9DX94_9ASCI|nr:vacuolar protein sorting-associated protein 26B [Phallusia mammillata]